MAVYLNDNALFFDQSLASVFEQSVQASEVVLVEDGPLTDALYAVVAQYKERYSDRFRVISLPCNEGLGKALNEGLKHCSYEWVARMDADDICKRNRFEKLLQVVEKDPGLSVVGSWLDEFIESPDRVISQRRPPEKNEDIVRYFRHRSPLNHPTVMFKKSDVLAVGGYQHFPLLEDYHLWGRLIAQHYRMYNLQESLLLFRIHSELFVQRRGGLAYAHSERLLFGEFLKWGLITRWDYFFNVSIRTLMRILPPFWRAYIYRHYLR